jgi:hypothetical protein
VDSAAGPRVLWPSASFNADYYPDFLVYDSRPDSADAFTVSCHNGANGALLWTRNLPRASDDADATSGGVASRLELHVLGDTAGTTGGDFNLDGRRDVVLYYTFGRVSGTTPVLETCLNAAVLSGADGSLLPPTTPDGSASAKTSLPSSRPSL